MVRNHPIIAAVVILFLLFMLVTQPVVLADATVWLWNTGGSLLSALGTYFSAVAKGISRG